MAKRYDGMSGNGKKKNPAKSREQYRLAQAVLAGYSDAMPKRVAREIVDGTPKNKRSEYMRGGRGRQKNKGEGISEYEKALAVAEGFHGRPARDIEDVIEIERYRTKLAKLGDLVELEVLCKSGKHVIPITFASEENDGIEEDFVSASSTPDRNQILFVGGNQIVDLEAFDELNNNELAKDYVFLGECFSISYFTDKHHLEGPEYQKDGTPYIHKFGEEEGGERPFLVYDKLNEHLLLVGGSYEVRDEGIWN